MLLYHDTLQNASDIRNEGKIVIDNYESNKICVIPNQNECFYITILCKMHQIFTLKPMMDKYQQNQKNIV
jgi:hypothetical protein